MMTPGRNLVLASRSSARRRLLDQAGVAYRAVASEVDEDAVRVALLTDNPGIDGGDVADALARVKAEMVSAGHPDDVVLSGDQVLSCEGKLYSKAETVSAAQSQLLELRGKTHRLHSAVAIAEAGDVVWTTVSVVDVTFRDFSPQFLGRYLAIAGDSVLSSVGAYHLEGLGIQLVEKIEGDFFAVLGLPLIEVLAELRNRGVVIG